MKRPFGESLGEFEESVETRPEQAEVLPEIRKTLEAHIVDLKPDLVGRRELIKKMGNSSVGAAEAFVNRPDPPLYVDSATLTPGKIKVLIGPNGSGKSTVFDAFMERDAHFDTQNGQGAVVYGDPVHVREKLRIARLDQEELLSAINELTAREVLEGGAKFFKEQFPVDWDDMERYEQNLKNQDAQVRIDTLMSQITTLFEMNEFLDTEVEHLSGGERTKLSLLMVLSSEPDVLLLDEPTNHLDLGSISKLMALFEQYREANVATINVSHVDWFLQDAGVDGVLEIAWNERGRVLKESNAPYKNYVKDSSREYTPIISGDIEWLQEGYGYKIGTSLVSGPKVFTVPDSPLKEVAFPTISGGEIIVMSGNNGTGKTKLMETIAGNRREDLPKKQKGVQIAYLPQFWPEEAVDGTLRDFFDWVKETSSPHSSGSAAHKDQPAHKLFIELGRKLKFGGGGVVGESWFKRPFSQFSGGEQRLLWFLAVSSLRDVDMMMIDEPTNHMDRDLQKKVAHAIRTFPGAALLATHDRILLGALAKDSGKHALKHIILEKKSGKTNIVQSDESPDKYTERIMANARRESKKVKIT